MMKEQKLFAKYGFVVLKNVIPKNKITALRKEVIKICRKKKIEDVFLPKKKIFWKKNSEKLNEIRLYLNYKNKVFKKFYKYKKFYTISQKLKNKKVSKFSVDKVRFNIPSLKKTFLPWHQDEITWPKKVNQNPITFWVPLVEVNYKNGIELIKLKNKLSNLKEHQFGDDPKTYLRDSKLKSKFKTSRIYKPKLLLGDIIAFDAFVPHRSCKNLSSKIRISIDTRFK